MEGVLERDADSSRARFGAEMRRYRESAQLSQSAVAVRLGCTQTQVSRLEVAKRTPSRSDAEKLDQIFGLTDRQYFVGLYRRIVSRSGGPSWFMGWMDEVEPRATVLRSWDPLLIPGMLQTEAYARHVFLGGPQLTNEQVDERVRARMQRQQILDRVDPPLLLALIDSGVLRRQVGGPDVMREQLGHLLEAGCRPSVSIQVVDPRCLAGMLGAFMIAELPDSPDVIHADSTTEGQISTDQTVVAAVWRRYEAIRLWTYPEHVSRTMIEEARQKWI